MSKPVTAYIGLGSNLGDREKSIESAVKMLGETPGVEVGAVSSVVETAPLANAEQPRYLNAVAQIRTTAGARELHRRLTEIEGTLGRVRDVKWSARTIDLDLLLFGSEVISTPELTVPHPQMHLRSFVLCGLCQLNGEMLHPVLKWSMNELAGRLNGQSFAPNRETPQLVSVAGIIGVGKTTLAKKLSGVLGCKPILEAYDTNPFLPEVYAGKMDLALDSQLYFLASRLEQLGSGVLAPGRIAVSDYVFDKELIYARRLLEPRQLSLYERIYLSLEGRVSKPVLAIYLTDTVENCLERIRRRNRSYEQVIRFEFLERLNYDYERMFADWKACPVIRVSMSRFDCLRNGDVKHLAGQVRSYAAV